MQLEGEGEGVTAEVARARPSRSFPSALNSPGDTERAFTVSFAESLHLPSPYNTHPAAL